MSDQQAVDARQVTFRYGERRALSGVTFQVSRGQIFGFLGPNGGGKTTLFQILATLLRPQEGSIRIFGSEISTEAALVRRQLGVVFQSASVDQHLTVLENLIHQGHLYGLRGQPLRLRAGEVLDRFDLSDRRGDRVKTLSGGLRRRVEIAKALLHDPQLLLLDEPSTGLDPGARRDLWRTLEELRTAHHVTVLLTTHFMEEGDRCDRLALIDRGRVVAEGEPAGLKKEIGGDVVWVRAGNPEQLGRDLQQRFGLEVSIHGDDLRFDHPRAHEFVGRVAEAFPGRIRSLTMSKPTLEDVFLGRTGRGLGEEDG